MRMHFRGPFPIPLRGRGGPAAGGLPPADLGLDVMHDRPDSKSFRGLRAGHVAASAPAEPSVAGDGLFHSALTVPKALGDLTGRGHAGIVPPATAGPLRAARGLPHLALSCTTSCPVPDLFAARSSPRAAPRPRRTQREVKFDAAAFCVQHDNRPRPERRAGGDLIS